VTPRRPTRRAQVQGQRRHRARLVRRIAPMLRSVAICAPRPSTVAPAPPAVQAWSARRVAA
jgi:hypothetical protein